MGDMCTMKAQKLQSKRVFERRRKAGCSRHNAQSGRLQQPQGGVTHYCMRSGLPL